MCIAIERRMKHRTRYFNGRLTINSMRSFALIPDLHIIQTKQHMRPVDRFAGNNANISNPTLNTHFFGTVESIDLAILNCIFKLSYTVPYRYFTILQHEISARNE